MKLVLTLLLLLISTSALAKDVHDNGYYRKDGLHAAAYPFCAGWGQVENS